jgi:hypothetical protein
VGETLDQTRVELEAQRMQLQRTADELKARLKRSVDIKAKFKENPALFIGLGAGAVFLLAGGPMRAAHFGRRRLMRSTPERAYDSLPHGMQAWIDSLAGTVGPKAERARETLAGELLKWRQEPMNKKARKELAKQMVEGPPGPGRASWKAFEAAAAILSAALARKAVERFLSGEPPSGLPALDAAGTAGGAAKPEGKRRRPNAALGVDAPADIARTRAQVDDYSALSARSREPKSG